MKLVAALTSPMFGGFLLAAVLAAVMSTADSQLLVTSSAITEDLYRKIKKREPSQKQLVWIGRLSVIAVAIIAFSIALDPESSVLDLVAYAWAGFGATFGPVIVMSLFWKRMTRNGAISGILSGGLTVIIWKNLSGGIFNLYEIVPGFFISMLFIFLVSLFGKEPSEEIKDEFESVGKSTF